MRLAARLWHNVLQRMARATLRRQAFTPQALVGRRGEEAAYWHLRALGYIMVERNYRPPGSHKEIDLIGWDGDVLVFVEVKTRGPESPLLPESAVDREKERNLIAAAHDYRRRANRLRAPVRFDIVTVVESSGAIRIGHFRDAFRDEPAVRAVR